MPKRIVSDEELERYKAELAEKKKPVIIGRRINSDKKITNFPFTYKVVCQGLEREYEFRKGDIVPCWKCGEPIKINSKTAFEFEEQYYLHCPKCEADVSVFYYYDKLKHRV